MTLEIDCVRLVLAIGNHDCKHMAVFANFDRMNLKSVYRLVDRRPTTLLYSRLMIHGIRYSYDAIRTVVLFTDSYEDVSSVRIRHSRNVLEHLFLALMIGSIHFSLEFDLKGLSFILPNHLIEVGLREILDVFASENHASPRALILINVVGSCRNCNG